MLSWSNKLNHGQVLGKWSGLINGSLGVVCRLSAFDRQSVDNRRSAITVFQQFDPSPQSPRSCAPRRAIAATASTPIFVTPNQPFAD
jgi:hypothetical protein